MELDKIIITTIGVGVIGFIWWFFFGKRADASTILLSKTGTIDITVDGGYKPSIIKVLKGVPITLKIIRHDPNSCLEEIILPDFKISKYLPLNEAVEIKFTPDKAGEFPFHCGMNMFHGKLVVSE